MESEDQPSPRSWKLALFPLLQFTYHTPVSLLQAHPLLSLTRCPLTFVPDEWPLALQLASKDLAQTVRHLVITEVGDIEEREEEVANPLLIDPKLNNNIKENAQYYTRFYGG
jgi:hypothetical protein